MTLQHTSLEIRRDDVDAELAVWALLGFDHVETPTGLGGRATWGARDGTHIHLLHGDAQTVMPRALVEIFAPDYEATVERRRDAVFAFEPDDPFWGAERGFVRTPAGHRVEVMAGPPPP